MAQFEPRIRILRLPGWAAMLLALGVAALAVLVLLLFAGVALIAVPALIAFGGVAGWLSRRGQPMTPWRRQGQRWQGEGASRFDRTSRRSDPRTIEGEGNVIEIKRD